MNRLIAMSTLLAVADAGSLSAAARKLGAPLATISRRLSDLERHLGAQLLLRSGRRLELTDAGRAYVSACRDILDAVDQAERAAAGEFVTPRGEIRISAPIVFGRLHVLPILVDFLAAYPEIDAGLMLSDRNFHFIDDQIDVALRIGDLPDSGLKATRVGAVRRVICASPGYLEAAGEPLQPDDLRRRPCIVFDGLSGGSEWRFRQDGKDFSASIRARLVVNTAEAAIDAAVAGLGLARVLSYQAEEAVAAGRLRIVLRAYETPPLAVSLIYPAQGAMPQKLRVFLDFAADRLRQRIPAAPH